MNGRTARLLNRVARQEKWSRKFLKQRWQSMPWTKRHAYRDSLIELVLDRSPQAD